MPRPSTLPPLPAANGRGSVADVLAGRSDWACPSGPVLPWLRTLPANCVHTICTSPPYYGLRSYLPDEHPDKVHELGTEATPQEYVDKVVETFEECRRVMHPSGVLMLNVGDSYAGGGGGNYTKGVRNNSGQNVTNVRNKRTWLADAGLKGKDLIGIPWMVAFALRDAGWYLRAENIWHKPSPMPESVSDRTTRAHEQVFQFTKSPTYFYDTVATAEPTSGTMDRPQRRRAMELAERHKLTDAHLAAIRSVGVSDCGRGATTQNGTGRNTPEVLRLAGEAKEVLGGYYREFLKADTRNARSVWTIASKPYKGAHFATMPPELARRCILAGTSERGVCAVCGEPWVRVVEKNRVPTRPGLDSKVHDATNGAMQTGNRDPERHVTTTRTVGWQAGCRCGTELPPVPAIVADPFSGSGTTLAEAVRLGRRAIGCELNADYLLLIAARVSDAILSHP